MMLLRVTRRWLVGLLPFASLSLGVAESPPERKADDLLVQSLVKSFEVRYRTAPTLQATFLERYTENGRTVRAESGRAYFRRPGKMRWEYESPEKHLFLVDGKTAWFYVPGDHTVTRIPAKQSTDLRTPLALLAGQVKVSHICARVRLATSEKPLSEGHVLLGCTLRGAEPERSRRDGEGDLSQDSRQGDTVFMEIVGDSGELVRLLVEQGGGVQVEFRFEDWRMNPPVPDSLFRFEVPSGVAIVNGELPAGDGAVR
jgi:outer membrane lipoprotein carrier protein